MMSMDVRNGVGADTFTSHTLRGRVQCCAITTTTASTCIDGRYPSHPYHFGDPCRWPQVKSVGASDYKVKQEREKEEERDGSERR